MSYLTVASNAWLCRKCEHYMSDVEKNEANRGCVDPNKCSGCQQPSQRTGIQTRLTECTENGVATRRRKKKYGFLDGASSSDSFSSGNTTDGDTYSDDDMGGVDGDAAQPLIRSRYTERAMQFKDHIERRSYYFAFWEFHANFRIMLDRVQTLYLQCCHATGKKNIARALLELVQFYPEMVNLCIPLSDIMQRYLDKVELITQENAELKKAEIRKIAKHGARSLASLLEGRLFSCIGSLVSVGVHAYKHDKLSESHRAKWETSTISELMQKFDFSQKQGMLQDVQPKIMVLRKWETTLKDALQCIECLYGKENSIPPALHDAMRYFKQRYTTLMGQEWLESPDLGILKLEVENMGDTKDYLRAIRNSHNKLLQTIRQLLCDNGLNNLRALNEAEQQLQLPELTKAIETKKDTEGPALKPPSMPHLKRVEVDCPNCRNGNGDKKWARIGAFSPFKCGECLGKRKVSKWQIVTEENREEEEEEEYSLSGTMM